MLPFGGVLIHVTSLRSASLRSACSRPTDNEIVPSAFIFRDVRRMTPPSLTSWWNTPSTGVERKRTNLHNSFAENFRNKAIGQIGRTTNGKNKTYVSLSQNGFDEGHDNIHPLLVLHLVPEHVRINVHSMPEPCKNKSVMSATTVEICCTHDRKHLTQKSALDLCYLSFQGYGPPLFPPLFPPLPRPFVLPPPSFLPVLPLRGRGEGGRRAGEGGGRAGELWASINKSFKFCVPVVFFVWVFFISTKCTNVLEMQTRSILSSFKLSTNNNSTPQAGKNFSSMLLAST